MEDSGQWEWESDVIVELDAAKCIEAPPSVRISPHYEGRAGQERYGHEGPNMYTPLGLAEVYRRGPRWRAMHPVLAAGEGRRLAVLEDKAGEELLAAGLTAQVLANVDAWFAAGCPSLEPNASVRPVTPSHPAYTKPGGVGFPSLGLFLERDMSPAVLMQHYSGLVSLDAEVEDRIPAYKYVVDSDGTEEVEEELHDLCLDGEPRFRRRGGPPVLAACMAGRVNGHSGDMDPPNMLSITVLGVSCCPDCPPFPHPHIFDVAKRVCLAGEEAVVSYGAYYFTDAEEEDDGEGRARKIKPRDASFDANRDAAWAVAAAAAAAAPSAFCRFIPIYCGVSWGLFDLKRSLVRPIVGGPGAGAATPSYTTPAKFEKAGGLKGKKFKDSFHTFARPGSAAQNERNWPLKKYLDKAGMDADPRKWRFDTRLISHPKEDGSVSEPEEPPKQKEVSTIGWMARKYGAAAAGRARKLEAADQGCGLGVKRRRTREGYAAAAAAAATAPPAAAAAAEEEQEVIIISSDEDDDYDWAPLIPNEPPPAVAFTPAPPVKVKREVQPTPIPPPVHLESPPSATLAPAPAPAAPAATPAAAGTEAVDGAAEAEIEDEEDAVASPLPPPPQPTPLPAVPPLADAEQIQERIAATDAVIAPYAAFRAACTRALAAIAVSERANAELRALEDASSRAAGGLTAARAQAAADEAEARAAAEAARLAAEKEARSKAALLEAQREAEAARAAADAGRRAAEEAMRTATQARLECKPQSGTA